MPYVQMQDVRLGMDRKRSSRAVAELGTAWTIKNAHLTRGGDVFRRKKFVQQSGSFPSTTRGLFSIGRTLYTLGYDAGQAASVPPGITHILTVHPDTPSIAILDVRDAEPFNGQLYSIVEFVDGNIYHYYNTSRVDDWDTLATTIGSNEAVAAALGTAINKSTAVDAVVTDDTITIISETAGVPFTITKETTDNGSNPDQDIILTETQPNVIDADEVRSTADITITGGTSDPGVNKITSITIDGVDVLGAEVDWDTSNSQTASDIASQINTHTSSPDYTAVAIGPVVTISALAGTGAGPNGFVVVVNEDGDVTVDHDDEMDGGSAATTALAQVYTAQVVGTFDPEDQFKITINGTEDYIVTGAASGTGISVLTFKQKLYSTASSNLYFSALQAPTQWISGIDYGFINMSIQTAGEESLTVAQEYQGLMAIFSENNIRIWSVSESSEANVFLQTLQNTGTTAPGSVVPYGNNDVFYLDSSGIRSIKARDSSNAAYVSDVGTPIDTHIREYMDTLTEDEIAAAQGIVEPIDGRFWIGIKNRIYVLSHFPQAKITAWSYYEVDFDIQHFAKAGDRIYVRGRKEGVDYLYLYGGADNNTYPDVNEDVCVIELPYFSADNPAAFKELLGFDIIGINDWKVDILPDPANEAVMVNQGIASNTTYGKQRYGVTGVSSLFAVNLTCSAAGLATLSALAMHYTQTFEDG